MQRKIKRHLLMMQTDRGPRFVAKPNWLGLTPSPFDAQAPADLLEAIKLVHEITEDGGLDYHIEVVEVDFEATFSIPNFTRRRV